MILKYKASMIEVQHIHKQTNMKRG